jgi:CHAT domain-containing protein
MIGFYQHLSLGEAKAEALRDAQIELLKSGDPPYFWAGFELAGEPNATLFADPKSSPSSRSGQ